MSQKYIEYKVNLSEGQQEKLAKAFKNKCPHTLRLKYELPYSFDANTTKLDQ